jgi:hypothetical protein
MLAGIALLDFDQDGLLDAYFVNGAPIPSLVKEHPRDSNRLFRNAGGMEFTDMTEKAGAGGAGYGMGVAAGDFDNDGYPDLFLANVTDNQLLRNNRDGTFTDVTAKAGLAGGKHNGNKMWAVAAGWFDYDNDGDLDLFVVNYCAWAANKDPFCKTGKGNRAYCDPRFYDPLPNSLFRNNGDGTFNDVSELMGIAQHAGKGMSVSFSDADGDGFLDAFVTNDTMRNFFFRNSGGRKFDEIGLAAGVSFGENGEALSSMGSDYKDVNNDGRPDLWHTAIEEETFPLFLGRPNFTFFNATFPTGLGKTTRMMSGWSNGIFDFDNDGWKDLFVARSHVLDNVPESKPQRVYPEPNTVFRNQLGKKFEDVSLSAGESFQRAEAHRGAAFGDLDNDGRVDAVVTVLGGKARVFRNVSSSPAHWIAFDLRGKRSNRQGIGAMVKVTAEDGSTQWNTATTSVGYACSSDVRVHFGLGASSSMKEVEIRWPSGVVQKLANVAADRVLKVDEPAQ